MPVAVLHDPKPTRHSIERKSLDNKQLQQSKRLLVVDDEADLANLIAYNLRRAGYEVDVVHSGPAALTAITDHLPDLVVLDVMLPGLSGLEIARMVRTNPRTSWIPVLMLTARTADTDAIAGLAVGADDYVAKPFSMKVLVARIEALLRRAGRAGPTPTSADLLRIGTVEMDLSSHEARVGTEPLSLTLTEFRLLAALIRARGKILSRYDLMSSAMGPGVMVTTRTIDVHIASIRKKIGSQGGMIRTVRGVGYRMVEDGSDAADDDGTAGG